MKILQRWMNKINILGIRDGVDEDGNPHTQVDLAALGQKISVVTEEKEKELVHHIFLNDDPGGNHVDGGGLNEWFSNFFAIYSRRR